MKVLFMVRKPYFDAIVAGTKNEEIRRATKRWETVMDHLFPPPLGGNIGVFLCGRSVHRRKIVDVEECPSAETHLDRPLSKQGRKDIGTGPVIVFLLGDVVA